MLNYFGSLRGVLGGWKEKKNKKFDTNKKKNDFNQINLPTLIVTFHKDAPLNYFFTIAF